MFNFHRGLICALFLQLILMHAQTPAEELSLASLPPPAQTTVNFWREIAPLFQEKCQSCHGPDQQLSGFRLDNRTDAIRGGYSGTVIKPGDSANSRLIHLVAGLQKDLRMPMNGDPLTAEEIGLLRAWIDQGAGWPEHVASTNAITTTEPAKPQGKHWAFSPPRRPRLPKLLDGTSARNPIDAFVLAKLERNGIRPSPEAAKTTLIRRLSLDLIGLPPTPKEVGEFLADRHPKAYERLVDRLLASPHYGEKWARQWLDLAHYADSDGYEKDEIRPHAWKWRQWVIESLNQNMPFDQFTVKQVAGDLLPNSTIEDKVATGFNRNTLTNREGGIDREEYRVEQVIDRTSTLGTVWLGLTVGCARCHDHKYDPISQKEFYQLYAFFNNAREFNLEAPLPNELGA